MISLSSTPKRVCECEQDLREKFINTKAANALQIELSSYLSLQLTVVLPPFNLFLRHDFPADLRFHFFSYFLHLVAVPPYQGHVHALCEDWVRSNLCCVVEMLELGIGNREALMKWDSKD